jgi:hypothetical protein
LEARNIVLDVGEPEFLSDTTKKRILLIVVLVVIAAAVSTGVVLSQNSGSDSKPTPVVNETSEISPAASPSTTPSAQPVQSAVNEFLAGLPGYSIDLAQSDANSPQAKALKWLENDTLYDEYELHRLNQRYALAVLYYSTKGPIWETRDGWLSNSSECTWYTRAEEAICGNEHRLSILWMGSTLDGTIPTELELLSDLVSLALWDTGVLTVYPELYVL